MALHQVSSIQRVTGRPVFFSVTCLHKLFKVVEILAFEALGGILYAPLLLIVMGDLAIVKSSSHKTWWVQRCRVMPPGELAVIMAQLAGCRILIHNLLLLGVHLFKWLLDQVGVLAGG